MASQGSRAGVIRDLDLGMAGAVADVANLANSYVIIGFPDGTVTHDEIKQGRHKKGGLSMAEIAASNEFGTEHIPERSFMRSSFDENQTKIFSILQKEYGRILDGKSTVRRSLDLIGNIVRDMIKVKIRQITQPPNSQRTIDKKGSSKPLIDFGQMINAVQYKVILK